MWSRPFLLRLNVKEAISPSFLASLLFDLLHRILPVVADKIPPHTMEISPFPMKPQYNWNLIMWFFYMFWDIWPFNLYFIKFWLNIFICSKDLIAEMISLLPINFFSILNDLDNETSGEMSKLRESQLVNSSRSDNHSHKLDLNNSFYCNENYESSDVQQ